MLVMLYFRAISAHVDSAVDKAVLSAVRQKPETIQFLLRRIADCRALLMWTVAVAMIVS